jgi:hypothetical protein
MAAGARAAWRCYQSGGGYVVLKSSTTLASPQAASRRFACFRVVKFSVSGAHRAFCRGSIPGSSTSEGPQRCGPFSLGRWRQAPRPRGHLSRKVPLPEIGRKNLVHIHVGIAHEYTRVGGGDDHGLIKHSRGFAFTTRPRLRLPCPPVSSSG